jgi:hypothetical protein
MSQEVRRRFRSGGWKLRSTLVPKLIVEKMGRLLALGTREEGDFVRHVQKTMGYGIVQTAVCRFSIILNHRGEQQT